jgi:hypothetical protein
MKRYFDHERLHVYQDAIAFCGWVGDLLNEIAAKAAAKDQLDRASTKIPLISPKGTANSQQSIVLGFSKFPAVRRWNAQRVWTRWQSEKLSLQNESDPQKNNSFELLKC